MITPIERFLSALRAHGYEPKQQGAQWVCRCPAHLDHKPSCTFCEGEDGRVLLYCFAGCTAEAIVAAIGLTMRDLMPGPVTGVPVTTTPRAEAPTKVPVTVTRVTGRVAPTFATANEAVADLEKRYGPKSEFWTYHDRAGEPIGVIVRWDLPPDPSEPGKPGKRILPVSKIDGRWANVGMAAPRPLYRLPALLALPKGSTVYVLEGEKCADAARALRLIATTSVHGAQSPGKTDWSPLAGMHVIVVLDNDPAGEKYGQEVTALALAAGAASVRIVRLPGLGVGGDIVEFIQARTAAGLSPDAIRAEIDALAQAAPEASVSSGSGVGGGNPESWPEPQVLPPALPPVMPFDPGLLPSAVRDWIIDIAERIQCPIDFPAVSVMVALATVIGRKIGIRPKRHDDWTVVPNLWGGVIGRPGVMKTPAIQEPLKPLNAMEIRAKAEYDAQVNAAKAAQLVEKVKTKETGKAIQKAIKDPKEALRIAMESIEDDDDEAPVRTRYLVNDSTVEKLGEILNENPNGVLVFRDELIGLLKSLDKDGQEGARTFYLESWNGTGRYTYDRIGRGTLDIEAAILSLLGGIQPGPLGQYQRAAAREGAGDDGLLQRFQLAVWPDISKVWINVDRWPDSEARKRAYAVFEGLSTFEPELTGTDHDAMDPQGIPFLRFDDAAQEVFNAWRQKLELKVRSGDLHPAMESHLAKFRSLIPSLALIIHLADGDRGPVGLRPLHMAIQWGEYLESHAGRIYSQALQPDLTAARSLGKRILSGEVKDGFDLRKVYRKGWSGLASAEDAKGAADFLIDLEWVRETKQFTEGRTATVYHINPRLAGSEAAKNLDPPSKGTDRTDRRGEGGASVGSVSPDLGGPPDSGGVQ